MDEWRLGCVEVADFNGKPAKRFFVIRIGFYNKMEFS